jgi:cob(I)alamin adenosyltransferase
VSTFKFSKKGDHGETSLLSGKRVSKASLRPETYGTLDEATSALGIAKASTQNDRIRQMIENVQDDLVILGAELASEESTSVHIGKDRTLRLEQWIEELQKDVHIPRHFVLPGGTMVSAAVDLARSIVRRAERRATAMSEAGLLEDEEVHSYLNRLADYLFVLARYAEKTG